MPQNSTQQEEDYYMDRCIFLAKKGEGLVAPNPMVGAVLVYKKQIIGEGYHQFYGGNHAEVNCIQSVLKHHQDKIQHSTLFVNLEPCTHYGKTPPCTEFIVKNKIKNVIVGTQDNSPKNTGKGIAFLRKKNIQVKLGVKMKACDNLNKHFFTYHKKKRPYCILKFAESNDGFISASTNKPRTIFSNTLSEILTHKIRNKTQAIIVGKNTLIHDKPLLTERYWSQKDKLKIILDTNLQTLPQIKEKITAKHYVIVHNAQHKPHQNDVQMISLDRNSTTYYKQFFDFLYNKQINSLLIEGGGQVMQSFFCHSQYIDEIVVIKNKKINLHQGIQSPNFKTLLSAHQWDLKQYPLGKSCLISHYCKQ